jgi:hypothetical protein
MESLKIAWDHHQTELQSETLKVGFSCFFLVRLKLCPVGVPRYKSAGRHFVGNLRFLFVSVLATLKYCTGSSGLVQKPFIYADLSRISAEKRDVITAALCKLFFGVGYILKLIFPKFWMVAISKRIKIMSSLRQTNFHGEIISVGSDPGKIRFSVLEDFFRYILSGYYILYRIIVVSTRFCACWNTRIMI